MEIASCNDFLNKDPVMVLHANESRLSINEKHAGIGYYKIYNALQMASMLNLLLNIFMLSLFILLIHR